MRLHKFVLIIFSALLLSVSQPWWFSLPPAFGKYVVVAQTRDDRKAEADSLFKQGIQQFQTGKFEAALQSWEQALIIYRKIEDRKGEGGVLLNLGNTYDELGKYLKAIEYYQQSLAIAREIEDRKGESKALGNLGIAYDAMGDYPKAIKYQEQRLVLAQQMQDPRGQGQSLGNLSITYAILGDYPKAIEYQLRFLAIAIAMNDRKAVGQSMGNLGTIYRLLGDYPKAIEYHQASLAIARKIQDPQTEGNALGNLGNTYASLGDYSTAIEYFQQSLAKQIKSPISKGAALGNIGIAYHRLGDYPTAIKYHQQSLAIQKQIKDRLGQGKSLYHIGLAYYKQGNLTLAESTLIEGIKVYESLRDRELKDSDKVSFFETQRDNYNTLQQVCIAQKKTDAALEISERGRARAFVELLASQLYANSKEQFPTPPNIDEIKQTAKLQNATLVEYSIITSDFKVAGKRQVKESELYIWVIKPTGEITFRPVDLKPLWQKEDTSLEQLVEITRDSIGAGNAGIFQRKTSPISNTQNTTTKRDQFQITTFPSPDDDPSKYLKQLHQILIEPIADLLPTNPDDRVIFVPQDELFLVPFPALLDQKGKYLIEKHTILTAPSIQVLELTRQQKQKNQLSPASDTLIVGNPTMPSVTPKIGDEPQKLVDLPGAKLEADAIAKLLGTKALTGDAANKAAVLSRIPQAKIIHLATHGILNNFQALKSAIALAPTGKDDGLLTAEEILNFKQKLNADLVVLSACDTGRGRITGDGVIGLSRSLFIAGTPSVIVSLWAVPDAPTAELMTEFYKNLYKNKNRLDKAQALRMAMLKMKDKYSDSPRKWAAFTLIGESE